MREPYFLPPGLSQPSIAWIFMGAPGPGAGLHVSDHIIAFAKHEGSEMCLVTRGGLVGELGIVIAITHVDYGSIGK